MRVRRAPEAAVVDAVVDGHPVSLFPAAGGHAAVVGIDMDAAAGPRRWQVTAKAGSAVHVSEGELPILARSYQVQRLTVAKSMHELDPATERRAVEETEKLRTTYRAISGERLWRGRWLRPVADFAGPAGTPVVAANRGRVALVGEFFFPGRLVILDHGLGVHTAYFHLDTIAVADGQLLERGATLGTVGMTGRVTGPHLHFGAQVGAARIDPAVLLGLAPPEERD
jgi:hypothetical protein